MGGRKRNNWMKTYYVKKIFNGFVSVRSPIIQSCLKKKQSLRIVYNGKEMIIPMQKLRNPFQLHSRTFTSKFNGKPYKLYDFRFKPKDDKQLTFGQAVGTQPPKH